MTASSIKAVGTAADIDNESARETEKTLLVFDLVGEHCGLDVNLVREIVHVPPRITSVPNAPQYV